MTTPSPLPRGEIIQQTGRHLRNCSPCPPTRRHYPASCATAWPSGERIPHRPVDPRRGFGRSSRPANRASATWTAYLTVDFQEWAPAPLHRRLQVVTRRRWPQLRPRRPHRTVTAASTPTTSPTSWGLSASSTAAASSRSRCCCPTPTWTNTRTTWKAQTGTASTYGTGCGRNTWRRAMIRWTGRRRGFGMDNQAYAHCASGPFGFLFPSFRRKPESRVPFEDLRMHHWNVGGDIYIGWPDHGAEERRYTIVDLDLLFSARSFAPG